MSIVSVSFVLEEACGGANGERGREKVGLVTGSLRKKLVNFYVDAVDGYDDTTA